MKSWKLLVLKVVFIWLKSKVESREENDCVNARKLQLGYLTIEYNFNFLDFYMQFNISNFSQSFSVLVLV